MVGVVVKPMARAIMIRRMEGMYMVLGSMAKDKGGRRRGKDKHSSSRAAHTMCHGGLIDRCKVATLDYDMWNLCDEVMEHTPWLRPSFEGVWWIK